ncbi:alpha/beta fold hydrolase [Solwaraspora sp. WMMD792]|uniref:thioesterase II family protein n=1 Tax=Solwaraspora sp. WMMD792 TaxID=3016099 RepID=UPI002416DB5D|nr:alpha/beta fold hydrolase [Solwaraspora sp. WMMD792]MDG4770724.1 alpha/beta fold hydrolase [Solwaraspora sp. WMMD792]
MTSITAGAWIRRYHSAAADAPRLVCLPHAGGSASFYFRHSAALAPAVAVLAVQYPGRMERHDEPCAGSVADLADGIFEALAALPDLGDDVSLFGHSMGATVAFEVVRRLEDRLGLTPRRLFVSGRRAPSRHRDERVHTLDDDGLVAELTALDGSNSRVFADPEMRALLLPAIRNDYRAIETYRCTPDVTISAPVTVLTGTADPTTTPDEADAWRRHTTAGVTVHRMTGGHFFLNEHRPAVLDIVARSLSARNGTPGR